MARTVHGNLIGRAARGEIADSLLEPSDLDRCIARLRKQIINKIGLAPYKKWNHSIPIDIYHNNERYEAALREKLLELVEFGTREWLELVPELTEGELNTWTT